MVKAIVATGNSAAINKVDSDNLIYQEEFKISHEYTPKLPRVYYCFLFASFLSLVFQKPG